MTDKDKADKFRKIAKAFRVWGKLGQENTEAAVAAITLAIDNLYLINRAKDAYGFPDHALYNLLEWLGRIASGGNPEKHLGAYDLMTQKQLPGSISFPMVLEQWATKLEQAASVGGGHIESGKSDKPTVEIPQNLEELQAKIKIAKKYARDDYWNIICLVRETGYNAAPDHNRVMRAYRPCCCAVCGIAISELKNAESRLRPKRSKTFKKQYKVFKNKRDDVAVAIIRIVKPELDRRIALLHASKKG